MANRLSLCVALCAYNGARYLPQQLQSITSQTRLPDRVVITDDCSSDDTVQMLFDFQRSSPFPVEVVVNPRNLGYVKNFEKAINLSSGDVIVLSDQDDVWKPERLAEVEQFFDCHPATDAVFSNADLVDDGLQQLPYDLWHALEFAPWERRLIESDDAFHVLMRRNVVTGATMAFRSHLKPRLLPLPEDWVHDEWMAIVISAIGRIGFIAKPLISYRQHDSNQIGMRKLTLWQKITMLFKRRQDFHDKLLQKTLILREHLSKHQPRNGAVLRELDSKLLHVRARTRLQQPRWLRIGIVSRELLSGRYFRYSSGWKSVVRDLFEPL